MSLPLSGSQTVGPYFAIGLAPLCSEQVASASGAEPVIIHGQLLDGNGTPIPDGFIEVWQANPHGEYSASWPADSVSDASGFGRTSTSPNGSFRFTTVKPGAVAYDGERMQAPHLLVLVYMRGLLRHLVTRMYFPEELANLTDQVLQLVPAERRSTLIAQASDQPGVLHWNIVMRQQQPDTKPETVFFAW